MSCIEIPLTMDMKKEIKCGDQGLLLLGWLYFNMEANGNWVPPVTIGCYVVRGRGRYVHMYVCT